MYVPDPFRITESDAIFDVVENFPFGLLAQAGDGDIDVAHLPFLLDRSSGKLRCHVAAENSIWQHIDGEKALAIFSGPHCYISPRLCRGATFVPTWNYVAAHIRGTARSFRGKELAQLVEDLTAIHETEGPWSSKEMPEGVYQRMLKNIVGIEISIEEIEGKTKLSQNRTAEERAAIVTGLRRSEDPNSQSIAYLVAGLD